MKKRVLGFGGMFLLFVLTLIIFRVFLYGQIFGFAFLSNDSFNYTNENFNSNNWTWNSISSDNLKNASASFFFVVMIIFVFIAARFIISNYERTHSSKHGKLPRQTIKLNI